MPGRSRIDAENQAAEQVALECICGRTLALGALEGYEMTSFAGACVCGRVWSVTEMSSQAALDPAASEES